MFTPDDLAEKFIVEVAADWNEDTDSSSLSTVLHSSDGRHKLKR